MRGLFDLDILTLKSVSSMAQAADPDSIEGSILIRMAFATLLAVDADIMKAQGTSDKQVRLLPIRDELFEREGINVKVACDLETYEGFTDKGRADSTFIIDQLRLALNEGSFRFIQDDDGVRAWARRSVDRKDIPSLTEGAERYVAKKSHAAVGTQITLIDITFTMSALKQLIVRICDSYIRATEGNTAICS